MNYKVGDFIKNDKGWIGIILKETNYGNIFIVKWLDYNITMEHNTRFLKQEKLKIVTNSKLAIKLFS
jgi:hypothetical protein